MSDETILTLGYGAVALIILLLWIATGLITSGMYERKGGSAVAGFLLGALLGPLGVLIAAIVPSKPSAKAATEKQDMLQSGKYKECPHCYQAIDTRATVCPNCKRDVPAGNV